MYFQENENKTKRRGFWKKVKVRPVTTESFEVAESQFYSNTVNRLGDSIDTPKKSHDKFGTKTFEKPSVTTYKPKLTIQQLEEAVQNEQIIAHKFSEVESNGDSQKTTTETIDSINNLDEITKEEVTTSKLVTLKDNPGEVDLGTGTPDSTILDMIYNSPVTESSSEPSTILDRSDGFSFMDYLFGVTSPDTERQEEIETQKNFNKSSGKVDDTLKTITEQTAGETEKEPIFTTESSYFPEEITTISHFKDENTEKLYPTEFLDIKKVNYTKTVTKNDRVDLDAKIKSEELKTMVDTSTASNFLDPKNVVSTSKSTEISHETEICFRGKCIKASNDIL